MTRSAAKSRADKAMSRSALQASSQIIQPPDVVDIVPGSQWEEMLESTADIVQETVDGILAKVMENCFDCDIQRKLVPFTVSWARDHLLQLLERQFLCKDKGDEPGIASKTEDTEPLAATVDSWAVGCMPVLRATPSTSTTPTSQETQPQAQERPANEAVGRTETWDNQKQNVMAKQSDSPQQFRKDRKPKWRSDYQSYSPLTPTPPPKSNREKVNQRTYRLQQSTKNSTSRPIKK